MGFILVGISHKTAPVSVREKFSFTSFTIQESLVKLKQMNGIRGTIILSTCNRAEIYADSVDNKNGFDILKDFLKSKFKVPETDLGKYFYALEDNFAIKHIFRVASGLDSQVLGEVEIIGQVKSAFLAGRDTGLTNNFLNFVFEKALDIGVAVRKNTKLSSGNVSVGSVALNLLKRHFSDLRNKEVLIIGAGKIASLMSKYLREEKIKGFFVSNRTYAKARELALECAGEAVDFSHLQEKLKTAHIVISSTASPHIILKHKMVQEVMKVRQEPLFLLDLAIPQDIDRRIKDISNVSLFDLDDLKCVIEENYKIRKQEAVRAEQMIEQELFSIENIMALK